MSGLSALVAAVCVLASLRRLTVAVSPTSLDAGELRRALTGSLAFQRLRAAIGAASETHWERDLFAAFAERDPRRREALVNEQLTEFDGMATAWSRVPRICASLATSAGFLFASISLLRSMGGTETPSVGAALVSAVDAFSLGVLAAAFCAVIHVRAARAERHAVQAVDRLVERLEALSESPSAAAAAP
jgi:hypothetical protein